MKVILIGNYPPDKQESMILFSGMLERGFQKAGYQVEIWKPKVFFGTFTRNPFSGMGKWMGYLDKWVIYPLYLRTRIFFGGYRESNSRFHICDHSNSPYLAYLPLKYTAITCHDVLAIRGAFGHKDAYCEASRLGIILQKWILRNLVKAERLATVSMFTMRQLNELSNGLKQSSKKDWRVILNAFNQDFYPVQAPVYNERLKTFGIEPGTPYIFHVGSSLPRKNRKLLPEMLHALGNQWHGLICFAGQAIDQELMQQIEKLGLKHRVISVINPKHEDLVMLYSGCEAFVFPSYSEGFGWPVIEAQACGAPVLASAVEPMPEVSGGAALHADPDRAVDFANALISLKDTQKRQDLIERGFENSARFAPEVMMNAYIDLHRLSKN